MKRTTTGDKGTEAERKNKKTVKTQRKRLPELKQESGNETKPRSNHEARDELPVLKSTGLWETQAP